MARLKDAIDWIVDNDDTEWVHYSDPIPSVTACLVADLFDKDIEEITARIRKGLAKQSRFSLPLEKRQ